MSSRRLVISRGYYLVKTQIKLIIEIFRSPSKWRSHDSTLDLFPVKKNLTICLLPFAFCQKCLVSFFVKPMVKNLSFCLLPFAKSEKKSV